MLMHLILISCRVHTYFEPQLPLGVKLKEDLAVYEPTSRYRVWHEYDVLLASAQTGISDMGKFALISKEVWSVSGGRT